MSKKIKCALIGPGNIGTDLLAKLQRSPVLEPVWMVGIDPTSDGLKRAKEMGIKTTADGVDGLVPHIREDGVQIVFVYALRSLGDQIVAGINGIVAFFLVTGGLGIATVHAGWGESGLALASGLGMLTATLLHGGRFLWVSRRSRWQN